MNNFKMHCIVIICFCKYVISFAFVIKYNSISISTYNFSKRDYCVNISYL